MWKCKRCGKCCKFIIIPVMEPVDLDTEAYLDAHGILAVPPPLPSPIGGGSKGEGVTKLLIPAVCQYLKKGDLRGKTGEYYCSIHNDKFANCRLGGKKECEDAQRYYAEIEKARPSL